MADAPKPEEILFVIQQYQVLNKIGSGGMGEVFLAFDTSCKRTVAIKKLRQDKEIDEKWVNLFLNEVYITSQLTHPAIVPIYEIVVHKNHIYYVMPFIEGKNLSEFFTESSQDQSGKMAGSVSFFCKIFLEVCQAVRYAHSKGIIHRDLKPHNILVGPYGQVVIFDWGLANKLEDIIPSSESVPGSMLYVAPEVVFGKTATIQSEIYSLGLILYEMLTLRRPFHRETVEKYHDSWQKEVLVDPIHIAPYRNIHPILAHIAVKCLARSVNDRYKTIDELLHDLQVYLGEDEGWIEVATVDIHNPNQFEFLDTGKGLRKFSSKGIFGHNMKIQAQVTLGEKSQAIGFYFNVLKLKEKEGSSVWLYPEMTASRDPAKIRLKKNRPYSVRIECEEGKLSLFLDNVLMTTSINYLREPGMGLGLILKGEDIVIQDVSLSLNKKSYQREPFAEANGYLALKNYLLAFSLYKNIAKQLSGRDEGYKALLLAGITLLQANKKTFLRDCKTLFHETSQPLYYLLKILFYKSQKNWDQVLATYEEVFKSYPDHPLISYLHDELLCQLQKSHLLDQKTKMELYLLAFLNIPLQAWPYQALALREKFEPLFLFEGEKLHEWNSQLRRMAFVVEYSFWLKKPKILMDMIDSSLRTGSEFFSIAQNALLALLEMNPKLAEKKLTAILQRFMDTQAQAKLEMIRAAIKDDLKSLLSLLPHKASSLNLQPLWHILENALSRKKTEVVYEAIQGLKTHSLSKQQTERLEGYHKRARLLDNHLD